MFKVARVPAILAFFVLVVSIFCFLAAPSQGAGKNEILIGTPLPVTGNLGMEGAECKWAYEEAFKDINAKGGVFVKQYNKKLPLKLVVGDAESDPGKAAAAVERLVRVDKVDLLLSTYTLPLGFATAIAADKFHIYYHLTGTTPDAFREQHYKWTTDYFISMQKLGDAPFECLLSIPAAERPKNVALCMEDTADGRIVIKFFQDAAKRHKVDIAMEEPLAADAKDYTAQIMKLKAKNIDAVISMTSSTDWVTLVRQSKENDFNVKFFYGIKGTWGTEFAKALGKDSQYVFADGFWSESYPYPMAKELGERYFQRYNKHSVSIGLWYAMCQTLAAAIEKAGTVDSAKVLEAVLNTPFKDTVMGDIKYNPADGTGIANPTANQWIDGQLKLVWPFGKGASKVEVAPPWDKR